MNKLQMKLDDSGCLISCLFEKYSGVPIMHVNNGLLKLVTLVSNECYA